MYIYILSKLLNIGYIHKKIITKEHEFTDEMLDQFHELIELNSTEPAPLPTAYEATLILVFGDYQYNKFEEMKMQYMDENNRKDIIIKMSHSFDFFDKYPNKLLGVLPVFSWIEPMPNTNSREINNPLIIGIHIRRGDVSSTLNNERFISFEYYLKCILYLNEIIKNIPIKITIYSEGSIKQELDEYKETLNKIMSLEYKIDYDVIETFKELVNCDILFTGYSSFSYCAGILKQKGITIYPKFFRHSYPSTCLGIQEPNDIILYESNINKYINTIYKTYNE